jgi:hypothetical protein
MSNEQGKKIKEDLNSIWKTVNQTQFLRSNFFSKKLFFYTLKVNMILTDHVY